MEDSVITFNVFHHVAWGTTVSVYFWLVGASAGAFVISTFGWVFGLERFKPLALTAAITAILMLVIVPVLLTWDLGKPVRFIYLLIPGYWHATGPMAWGTVLICSYLTTMIAYTYFIIKNNAIWAKSLGILAIMLLYALEWYTGVVMEFNPGRFLNNTALAPLLFLTGAFISGIGLLILIVFVQNLFLSAAKRIDSELLVELSQYMMYGVVFDVFLLFLEFMQSTYGSMNVVLAHEEVLMGVFKFPYFWLEIVIGLAIPFFILVSPLSRNIYAIVAASLMVCVGVYGMRVWWVLGGQYLQSFY
ncbi:MAG: polysulfide reductase NrfD [Magnetococcales bacterium]|nr:polysulfide reductase NrfD [Magnetococcales bacterium]